MLYVPLLIIYMQIDMICHLIVRNMVISTLFGCSRSEPSIE